MYRLGIPCFVQTFGLQLPNKVLDIWLVFWRPGTGKVLGSAAVFEVALGVSKVLTAVIVQYGDGSTKDGDHLL